MRAFITIKELKEKLEKKEVSPQEVANFYRTRIKKYDEKLNSVIELFEDDGIKPSGTGALENIPYVYKDNISLKGKVTSAGSDILKKYTANYDATVNVRLKEAGALPLGRANMDEFAMGSSGEFSDYGNTCNPWDHTRTPGGSSSGPAAAVAAGLAPFSLGSETGGSVRMPSSFCGLVGIYPTYGLHSRYGLIAFTSSTDQIAPITKTVYDNALVVSALSGQDPNDSTSLRVEPKDYTKKLTGKFPDGLTIGIIEDSIDNDGIDPQISTAFERAIKHLEKQGVKTKTISLPHLKYGNAVYFLISRAEAASNLARFDGSLYGNRIEVKGNLEEMYRQTRHDGFGIEIKRRILTGNYALSSSHQDNFYAHANHVRAMIRAEFLEALKDVDLLISPTTPTLAFKLGELINDPITMYLSDYFLTPNCIIGTPALSLPCGYSKENLPIGLQFFGPPLSEDLLYQVAYAFEQSTDYHLQNPEDYE